MLIEGRTIAPGRADGRLLLLGEPLSLWGGVDLSDGRIVERTHPQRGRSIAGRVLAMAASRGSSSSSSALVELARAGRAPAAIVLGARDPILAVGALVAEDLYGLAIPIVMLDPMVIGGLPDGEEVRVEALTSQGSLRVGR